MQLDLIGGIGALAVILIACVEIAITVLVILTLYRLYTALGIYILEHEPKEEEEKEPEGQEEK